MLWKTRINLQSLAGSIETADLVTEGTASTSQLKRKLEELVSFLTRDNEVFDGTVLLTGTCIVPPNEFTLQDGDVVEIEISGIGTLLNTMRTA